MIEGRKRDTPEIFKLGRVDKAHEGDSHDAGRRDSKLIFMREIGRGAWAHERRGMGFLRALRDRRRSA